jgi:hypothetical protein
MVPADQEMRATLEVNRWHSRAARVGGAFPTWVSCCPNIPVSLAEIAPAGQGWTESVQNLYGLYRFPDTPKQRP